MSEKTENIASYLDMVMSPLVCNLKTHVKDTNYALQGPVSRKSRELFGPEKPFVKLRPAYSVKLVCSYVVKGIKIKITAKFRASRRLRFEDTKVIDLSSLCILFSHFRPRDALMGIFLLFFH